MPKATFDLDGHDAPVFEDLIRLRAGDTEQSTWYVDGFETTDSGITIKLYAKLDPTDADDASTTIALTAALSTPALDPTAREAVFSFSAANTTDLLRGRVFEIRVQLTRGAQPYVQTIVEGTIGAARPGSTSVAPSDEATLRLQGDATTLAAAKYYADQLLTAGITVSDISDIATAQTGITRLGTVSEGAWQGTAIQDTYLATLTTPGKVANAATTATPNSTPSTIVSRDALGSFAANIITAAFIGSLLGTFTGNGTGTWTGDVVGAVSGNAATATRLQTPRTINGVAFDGTADITVTVSPAASSLTGTTLASNVVNSSLTSVGTLTSLAVTGPITAPGGVVGNASTSTSTDHLTTSRTFALSGHVTASQGSDLSGNLTLTTAIANGVIVNAMIGASAAIDYAKLNLGGSIVNADVNAAAAIAYSKLALANSIVNADINGAAAIADTKLATISSSGKVLNTATTATATNTPSTIVLRDASGNFNAGLITATFAGNMTGNVTGSVTGNVTGNLTGNGTGTWTGNATSATQLQTSRTINGVAFDGTSNITVTAAAGTLTGTALAATVVTSSLTSVGVLASPHMTAPTVDSGGLIVSGATQSSFAGKVLIGTVSDNGIATLQVAGGAIWSDTGVIAPSARMGVSTNNAQLIFDGDSLTFGTGGSAPYSNSVTLTDTGVTYTKSNVAVAGRTAATLLDTAFTLVDAKFSVYAKNIVVVWVGINDLIGGDSANLTMARIRAYCWQRRKAGARVVICTLTSANGQETNREAVNTLIRTYWTEFADALADLGADANIGAHNAYLSSTYFNVDGIHLKDAGYAIVASLVQTAANNMLTGARFVNRLDIIGALVAETGIQATGGSSAVGSMYKNAGAGLILQGVTGSGSDFRIYQPDGATTVLAVLPGTSDIVLGGAISVATTLTLAALGGGTHQVSVGAADSGGSGFKVLRVPN